MFGLVPYAMFSVYTQRNYGTKPQVENFFNFWATKPGEMLLVLPLNSCMTCCLYYCMRYLNI